VEMIAVDFCKTLIVVYHISSHHSAKDSNYKWPSKNVQCAVYNVQCTMYSVYLLTLVFHRLEFHNKRRSL